MSFNVTFNNQTKTYDKPVKVLDIVGPSKDIICAYVNNRVRELTYELTKDSEVVPLTTKDRDAKSIYEASLRFLTAMAMHNIQRLQEKATIKGAILCDLACFGHSVYTRKSNLQPRKKEMNIQYSTCRQD